jgi:1,4-alpha-glucan branching enzyme
MYKNRGLTGLHPGLVVGVSVLACLLIISTSHATEVTFLYQPATPGAQSVSVAGSFNSWDTSANPLSGPSDVGLWKAVIDLPAGRYAYKFVVSGDQWITDETAAEFEDDGFGGQNSIVQVSGEAIVVGVAGAATAAAPAAKAKTYEVTFRHRPEGAVQEISVAGEFNDWAPGKNAMADLNEDGEYEATLQLPAGDYMYKFVINGDQWVQDTEHEDGAMDDGFGGANSIIVVGGGAEAAVATAAPAAVGGDGVLFVYAGPAQSVNLAGDFNNWSTTADPMTQADDGTWQLTKPLPAGSHAYKFVINGTDWKEDPNAAEFIDDGFGGKNSVVTVGGATASATAAVAVTLKGADAPPKITPEGVLFTFPGPAQSAALAGDFNNWSTTANPMTQSPDGSWTILMPLKGGTYAYKFFIDGKRWETDAPNQESKDDGFGGKNSIVTVP